LLHFSLHHDEITPHPIENIIIPEFDPKDSTHQQLAALSRDAHTAATKEDSKAVERVEKAINQIVEKLW